MAGRAGTDATYVIAGARMAELLEKHRAALGRTEGIAFLGANSGEELLALHRERLARLLILDVLMPGLPPEEICRVVRAEPPLRNVSLIVIGTALSVPTLRRCAANRSFTRPLDQNDFLGAVRQLIQVAARQDFRVLVGVQLSGLLRQAPFFGRSENISATGILFSANRALEVGDRPELSVMLPGQGQLHTVAEIVRAQAAAGTEPTYGARFIDPSSQARQMIGAFIERRMKLPAAPRRNNSTRGGP